MILLVFVKEYLIKLHRFISLERAKELTKIDRKNSKYVGVLVNPSNEQLAKFSKINFDYFQIYGNYTANNIREIKDKYDKHFSEKPGK